MVRTIVMSNIRFGRASLHAVSGLSAIGLLILTTLKKPGDRADRVARLEACSVIHDEH